MEMLLNHLRVADVELFIAAAQMKHLGKAAACHHLSQSAVSAAMLRVESVFGVPLCRHEKRQFRLTSEGEALLPLLEDWVKQLRTLISVKSHKPLRLVTTHAIAQVAVPAVLSMGMIDFRSMRPDHAYAAIIQGEADLALVLDNAPWKEVVAVEVSCGAFQLCAKKREGTVQSVLLPEDQMEVLALQQQWQHMHGTALPVKARIPSWSLIAQICAESNEVGFLPEFLAKKRGLHPVPWSCATSDYRVLAIYRSPEKGLQEKIDSLIELLRNAFAGIACAE